LKDNSGQTLWDIVNFNGKEKKREEKKREEKNN
jgi:hypothetical protein